MKVLALAGYDSFLNTVRLIAPYFEAQGADVDFALVSARNKKQISREQVTEMGFKKPISLITIKDLCRSGDIQSYDIVLSCLEGLSTRRLFHYLAELKNRRPLVISVYPGLVLRYAYDGFSMRAPADLLWLNCKRDLEAYSVMCQAFGVDASNARQFGIASLLEKIEREPGAQENGPIVFFEQAVIPRYYDERNFMVKELCVLARRYPEREFLIKARAPGKKATLHRTWHAIERLFQELSKSKAGVPENIHLTDERAASLLSRASHCLTISSTVAAEAINAGVPTTLISDFGAHDDYGLQYFYESGLIKSFNAIDLDKIILAEKKWLEKFYFTPEYTVEKLVLEALNIRKNNSYNLAKTPVSLYSSEFNNYLSITHSPNSIINRNHQRKISIISRLSRLLRV
ncbi:DUF6716 putative glycosyltransferase [Roseibium algae]|uniref:DUF6716 putative glycosyltransferase n=1 Tax=Roseibium algae TaxID=3123038 RepID=A0ABU8TS65_9HYPH